ncbi:Chaperone protein DnaJ [Rhynchospora pubera]|uniref:Chaperone protein DnaJ n=1 Tax=Rhynchospora pubera TaxID=906938 RepID=A0AAV8GPB1_9POAL|nr:Chaperone protein DnaJ [Rhynchospora pubera]
MNRVKFAPLITRGEWRLIEGAELRSPSPFSAASFLESCSFHSTAMLERKRKTQWHYRFNSYGKRKKNRNRDSKRTLFHNISDYAEFLFQSWREEEERRAPIRPSWFRNHHWVRNSNRTDGFYPHGPQNSANFYGRNGKGSFVSNSSDDDDDEEGETVFASTFGRGRFYYWSFDRSNTTSHNYRSSRWSCNSDEDDEDGSFDTNKTKSDMALARKALGLRISGPLKLEEVKSAYRVCALRWHPDRHHGSSKVEAEEKFKHCCAAYKTLCDSLL